MSIKMEELCLQLTKYQYHDFMMLLQSVEYMNRASQFRKYKSRHSLENLPNYRGKFKSLWKFAFDCVYEEEVIRKINNWSWSHIQEHLKICRKYKEMYKERLITKKPSDELLKEIQNYEEHLDEVNIRIQRQLAEREVDQKIEAEREKANEKAPSGFWGWFSGKINYLLSLSFL